MKRFITLFGAALSLAVLLTACGPNSTETKESSSETAAPQTTAQSETAASQTTAQSEAAASQTTAQSETAAPQTTAQNETDTSQTGEETTGILYIGTTDSFKEYPFTGEKTPDNLIAAIGDLTGWDLSLADSVTDGKGGMTVCFTKDSAIFTGPPEPQNEDFFVYDHLSLMQTVLDSIQKTLQENYVDRELGGDPSLLDIYYCVMEDGNPTSISFPEESISIPMDMPYEGITIE